jgi:ribosomal protein L16 Arg81 hydroxylase
MPEVFLHDYWEVKPLVINRHREDYFESLPSLDDIDHVITTLNLRYPEITIVNADQPIARDQYTLRGDTIDVAKLYQLFADGSTIILNQLHKRMPSLAAFCLAMEQHFCMPFQTNIYLTPRDAKGFKPHYDTHDVFVLQILNSKHWMIYDTPVVLPLRGQEFDSSVHKPGPTALEFDLHAGDIAYIPRGFIHDARSCNDVSLHITVGALAYTWTDLLLEALSAVSLTDPDFRKALPVGFARPEFDKAHAHEVLHELLRRCAAKADVQGALDCFAEQLVSICNPLLKGQMAQIQKVEALTLDTEVSVRPGVIYRLQEDNSLVRIRCHGKEISLPIDTKETVQFALNSQFVIRDLPGGLDDAGKLVLVRRLIREGLLVVL